MFQSILYVHGFGSSGQSGTVTRLRNAFPQSRVIAPDLPLHPQEAIGLLRQTCEREKPSLIVGTSMGGMYTEMLYGYDRILVNPAFRIADTMQSHGLMGRGQYFSPRQDGVQEFYVDKPLVKEYRQICEQNFLHASDEGESARVFALFGDNDELVDTRDLFAQHYPQHIGFHGGHRMSDHSFNHAVLPVMRWISDRQQHRARPVIYIGVETLIDKWGKPAPSAQKAIETLLPNYQLYFVGDIVPRELNDGFKADVAQWLTEHVGVPAWRHTVFTDRRDLLMGDYLVETQATADGMATRIDFGSDTFKTWDDIISYFSLLGGQ